MITWKRVRRGLLCVSVAACMLSACHSNSNPPQPPNVIIVLSDALRAANLPLYGYPRNTTPNLVDLAKEGVIFDSHFAHYPGTTVSISQLHTGRLMAPLLISYKYIAVPVRAVQPDLLLLPRAFADAGYRTGIITAHYWMTGDQSWLVRYFQEKSYVPTAEPMRSYAAFEEMWPTITRFLDKSSDDRRPFFLYLHAFDTHGPNTYHPGFDQFRGSEGWPEAYNLYDSEIAYTDHWVGKLLAELRRRKMLDNTIFVFTADHGDDFNEAGPEKWNSNHGPFPRRSLLHVPLIMRLPGARSHGLRYQGVTRHIDVAPTLMRLALPTNDLSKFHVDGDDLSAELLSGSNGAATTRTSFAFTPHYWGLTQRDVELTYDLFSGTFSPLYRPVPDQHNYPALVAIDDPARRDLLMQQLAAERDARITEFVNLPPTDELPNPALVGFMLPVMEIEKPSPDTGPVMEDDAHDNRWAFQPTVISLAAGETPAPLTLSTPWVPGTYTVAVQLSQAGLREGLKNDFLFTIGHGENAAAHVLGASADAQGWVDIGTQTIGNRLTMGFSQPLGGVKATGIRLLRPSGPPPTAGAVGSASTPASTPDEAVRERLRVLGYGD